MSFTFESLDYKGFNISVNSDDFAESPREMSHFGTMVFSLRRYTLGDEQTDNLQEYLETLAEYSATYLESDSYQFDMTRTLNRIEKNYVILPIYAYIHSGITISTSKFSCSWDSGLAGFIYISKKDARNKAKDWFKYSIKQVETILQGEVETYDQYLTGDVKYYNITEISTSNELDSCYGFYSTAEEIIQECKEIIDREIETRLTADTNKVKELQSNQLSLF